MDKVTLIITGSVQSPIYDHQPEMGTYATPATATVVFGVHNLSDMLQFLQANLLTFDDVRALWERENPALTDQDDSDPLMGIKSVLVSWSGTPFAFATAHLMLHAGGAQPTLHWLDMATLNQDLATELLNESVKLRQQAILEAAWDNYASSESLRARYAAAEAKYRAYIGYCQLVDQPVTPSELVVAQSVHPDQQPALH
ncbi:hypothetical protein HAP94_04505 [Acidithiobacillus ferrivorans]|nr:hypothetical protein [Acidithiobacillus ferrivorans]